MVDGGVDGFCLDITERRLQPERRPTLVVNVVGTFTTEPLQASLKTWCAAATGARVRVKHCGYDTVMKELLSPDATFAAAPTDSSANFVFVRMSDVKDELCAALAAYDESAVPRATLVVVGCPNSARANEAEMGYARKLGSFFGVARMCNLLERVWFAEAEKFLAPSEVELDPVAEKIGAMPYSQFTYDAFGTVAARALAYSRRSPPKVVCVDCDDTLWRGAVGEVGAAGVVGNLVLMERLAHAKAHGVLLVTVSKNVEEDVLAAFAAHAEEWPLKADDFVAHKVSYAPKSQAIREVKQQLKLTWLKDFVFLDDNAAEIAEVQANLAGVTCLHVPTERPDDYCRACWALDTLKATREDAQRTTMVREEAARQNGAKALDFGAWIASLELRVSFTTPQGAEERARVVQLSSRTNQFNFSEKRLRAFPEPPAEVTLVTVVDKYGDYGAVGVLVVTESRDHPLEARPTLRLDHFVMSCRVLGRGVEQAMMSWVGALAVARGCATVVVRFDPTERNLPARQFLSAHGILPGDGRTPATRAYDAPRIAAIKFDPGQATTASAEQVEVRVDSPRKENGGCGGAPVPLGAHDVALRIWAAVGKPRAADVVGDTLEERIIDAVRQALGRRAAAALRADPSTSLVSLGVDSLAMVRIISLLHRELGELDAAALQRAPTIAQWVAMSEGVPDAEEADGAGCASCIRLIG